MEPGADAALHDAVARMLGQPVAGVRDVGREPLEYDVFLAHRSVNRLRGDAVVGSTLVPWSMIEKRTESPDLASAYLYDNGMREFEAYESGLLEDLGRGIRAPRAYGASIEDDGSITLWLEEVADDGPRPLVAAAVLAAAHGLGTMNGRWRQHGSDEPWLFSGWIDRHGQPEAVEAGLRTLRDASPEATARLGDSIPRIARLIRAQGELREVLESLPHTICHHDTVGANLFVGLDDVVLIDWESVGPGPVGADLASFLFSSVRRGDATAAVVAAVLPEAMARYTEGLHVEAAHVTADDVRLGFDAAVALRWKLGVDVVADITNGEFPRRGSRPHEPPETALEDHLALVDLLLASADRALPGM